MVLKVMFESFTCFIT